MKTEYNIVITDREDGLAYVSFDKPIIGIDAEHMIVHILMSSWSTEGSDPFCILSGALGRCNDAMRGEWKNEHNAHKEVE